VIKVKLIAPDEYESQWTDCHWSEHSINISLPDLEVKLTNDQLVKLFNKYVDSDEGGSFYLFLRKELFND
jgi:hypothetical protein